MTANGYDSVDGKEASRGTTLRENVTVTKLGIIGGSLLVLDGVLGIFVGHAFGLDLLHVVLELFMVCFGVIMLLVEGADKYLTQNEEGTAWASQFRGKLHHFARFIFVPIGRGYFYLYIAVMLMAQYPDPVDLTVSVYMLGFVVFCLVIGYSTQKKLFELKCEFNCTEDLNTMLVKTNGYRESPPRLWIKKDEFRDWCKDEFDIVFECNEVDAAFLIIDADQDGAISFVEMEEWWGHDI